MINDLLKVLAFLLLFGLTACGGMTNSTIPQGVQAQGSSSGSVTGAEANAISRSAFAQSRLSRMATAQAVKSVSINVGGPASGNWVADVDYSGGTVSSVTSAINVSKVANPAPQAVYQTQRWGKTVTYTIPNLSPGGTYLVRLHFAETYWNEAGARRFNCSINGVTAFTSLDIFTVSDGKNIALVKQYNTTATASGKVTITFTTVTDNATVAGIELSASSSSALPSETPQWSDTFVDSVGINTHLYFTDSPYGNSKAVPDLIATHIRHIRDSGSLNYAEPAYYSNLASLAKSGVHSMITVDENESAANIKSVIDLAGDSVELVEYPNELDLTDSNWQADIQAYGKQLYSEKSQFGVKIVAPSFAKDTRYSDFAQHAFNGMSDFGNMHPYFSGNPDDPALGTCSGHDTADWMLCSDYSEPTPVISTETGFTDVTSSVQARYLMRALLNSWNLGVPKTYIYQLIDENTSTNLGLLDTSLNLKPAFYAISNLLSDLADPGAKPTLKPLQYSLSGAVDHMLLQKQNGEYHLLLWDPVRAEDPNTPSVPVTLTFASVPSSITRHVWTDAGSVQTTAETCATVITESVTDRVTELVIK